MKAHFYKRVLAYLIDSIIVSLAISIITGLFLANNNIAMLQDELNSVMNLVIDGAISIEVYINRALDISYDIQYQTIGHNIVTFTICVLYYIIFQFKNDGRTIGKKLMKIKIVGNGSSIVTMDDIAKRSLIINGLAISMIELIGILILNKTIFLQLIFVTSIVKFIITTTTIFMILYRKDGRGLHDLFANTKVIIDKGV